MGTILQQTLRSLCCGTAWNYAVFWKLKRRSRMMFSWEDAYYEQKKVSSVSSAHILPNLPLNGMESGRNTHDDGVSSPDGCSVGDQIGLAVAKMSYQIMEDLELVNSIKTLFGTLQNVPGAFLPDSIQDSLSGKIQGSILRSISLPLNSPGNPPSSGAMSSLRGQPNQSVKRVPSSSVLDLVSLLAPVGMNKSLNAQTSLLPSRENVGASSKSLGHPSPFQKNSMQINSLLPLVTSGQGIEMGGTEVLPSSARVVYPFQGKKETNVPSFYNPPSRFMVAGTISNNYTHMEQQVPKKIGLQGPLQLVSTNVQNGVQSQMLDKDSSLLARDNLEGGASWALELGGGQAMGCPIIVENMSQPRQMLVEMLCEERGLFLEIADIIRSFGLTILKGVMEARNDKVWAHFVVEANRDVHRLEILWSLMQLLKPNAKNSSTITNQSSLVRPQCIDSVSQTFDTFQQSPIPTFSMPKRL